eukprot:5938409-Alexandrium_andersonii.AAC.1
MCPGVGGRPARRHPRWLHPVRGGAGAPGCSECLRLRNSAGSTRPSVVPERARLPHQQSGSARSQE